MKKNMNEDMIRLASPVFRAKEEMEEAKEKYRHSCKEFGKCFRFKRKSLGISLRECAKSLGLTPAFLSDVELGRRYPNDKIFACVLKKQTKDSLFFENYNRTFACELRY